MAADTPPVGTLLTQAPRMPLAQMNRMGPGDAAIETLAAYLKAAVFQVGKGPKQRFRLKRVVSGWPENFKELEYPSASITELAVEEGAHSLTPTALEETLDQYAPGTVLWKTSEQAIRQQLDFWVTNQKERGSIEAALGELFSPTEERFGIVLQGPEEYWCLPIRYTLLSHERLDSGDGVQARQRRLRVMVLADVDVVQLRKAVRLDPRLWVNGEPVPLESTGGP